MRHRQATWQRLALATHRLGIRIPEAEVEAMRVRAVEEQTEALVVQLEQLGRMAMPDGTAGRMEV